MELKTPDSILLISCYELGHQPLGVALPQGFLERAGFAPRAMDIAVEQFDAEQAARASFIGISVPMHTAMRLGVRVIERIREINPDCHICCYGLYASLNSAYLLEHGADSCIGGEFESPLVALIEALNQGSSSAVPGVITRGRESRPNLERLQFAVPSRGGLPVLDSYAHLEHDGESRTAGMSKPAAAVCTCVRIARFRQCTEAAFLRCPKTWCWKTFASRSKLERPTLRSVIPIFSTGQSIRCAWSVRCIRNFRS